MGPKYEFTDETIRVGSHVLHRIRRLSDNQLGGWIEKESNLSQDGNCWVSNEACIFDDAHVSGNAIVSDNAEIHNNAAIFGRARIYDNAKVYGNAKVYDNAWISGDAKVFNNAKIYNKAWIFDIASVSDNAEVFGSARVYHSAHVSRNAKVYGNAQVYGHAGIVDDTLVYDNAQIYDNAWIYDNAKVYGDAKVFGNTGIDGTFCDNNEPKMVEEPIRNFIYKIDDLQKLEVQTEYDSINEFFSEPAGDDLKLDTLIICTIDTKEPIIKLQKVDNDGNINFKFIVEITNSKGEEFIIRSFIESQEQLNKLIKQTVEALTIYPQFNMYADELEEIIS